MKKILSLVLVIALVLGSFSFAFAVETPSDVVGTDYEKAVETLMALGVVNGYEDGTYKPTKVVTRAEMAKLIVYELGYEDLAGGNATFSDTAGHWAEGYIALATGLGLTVGYPDGTFKPDQEVSFDEAITMVVRAIGYTDGSLTGTWPTNYKVKAINLELLDGVKVTSSGADRGAVAQILYNALDVAYGEVNADDEFVPNAGDEDGPYKIVSKIGAKQNDVFISYADVYDDEDALDTAIDLAPYLFQIVDYYENADEEVAYVSTIETDQVDGIVDYVDGDELDVEDADGDIESFDIDYTIPMMYNGAEADYTDVDELSDDGNCEVTVIYDPDNNDLVKGVIAWEYDLVMIGRTYKARTPLVLDEIQLPITEDADDEEILDEDAVTVEGDADDISDIETDDLVYVYAADDQSDEAPEVIKLMVVRDTIQGKVTEILDDSTAIVDGVELEDGDDVTGAGIAAAGLGDEIKVYLDKDGDVYDWTTEIDEDGDVDYAIFVGVDNGTVDEDPFNGDLSVDDAPRVKLLTESGDMVIYDIETEDLDVTTVDSIDFGDLQIDCDGTDGDIVVTTEGGLDYKGLVEYELNSDGEVDSIELVDTDAVVDAVYDPDDMLLADSYDVTGDTVIFDIRDTDEDEWDSTDDATLGEEVSGRMIVDDNYAVDVIVVTSSDADELDDNTYAMITDINDYYDGKDIVQKIKAFVDGDLETFYTDAEEAVDTDVVYSVQTLDMDDDEVTDTDDPESDTTFIVDEVVGAKIRKDVTGILYTTSDDVVVYVIEDDKDGDVDVYVGDLSDILEGDEVQLIDTDADTDEYEIVVLDLRDFDL